MCPFVSHLAQFAPVSLILRAVTQLSKLARFSIPPTAIHTFRMFAADCLGTLSVPALLVSQSLLFIVSCLSLSICYSYLCQFMSLPRIASVSRLLARVLLCLIHRYIGFKRIPSSAFATRAAKSQSLLHRAEASGEIVASLCAVPPASKNIKPLYVTITASLPLCLCQVSYYVTDLLPSLHCLTHAVCISTKQGQLPSNVRGKGLMKVD